MKQCQSLQSNPAFFDDAMMALRIGWGLVAESATVGI